MTTRDGKRGWTLVEVLVAMSLLALMSMAASQLLVGALRARERAEVRLRAVLLAAQAIELLRAGHIPGEVGDPYRRSAEINPWPGLAGLRRVEVVVLWKADASEHSVRLATLLP